MSMPLLVGPTALLSLMLASVSTLSSAQPVYKSTAADGAVSYGEQPTTGANRVQQVEVDPGPSHEQVLDARRQGQRTQASADRMQVQREGKEQIDGMQREARSARDDALKQVEEFKQLMQQQIDQNSRPRFGPP